jgi:ubiquinone/menaquinone biosynthesis C-methylase UbiE
MQKEQGMIIDQNANDCVDERMDVDVADAHVFWEHVYRYAYATRFVKSKHVLDAACGTGYGARGMLDAGAASVTGVDLSTAACLVAKTRYGVEALCMDVTQMSFEDGQFDVATSFETIEHLNQRDVFLDDICRVLKPDGLLVISSPNRECHNMAGKNRFHVHEFDLQEFERNLRSRFTSVSILGQSPVLMRGDCWNSSLRSIRSSLRRMPGYWRMFFALFPELKFKEVAESVATPDYGRLAVRVVAGGDRSIKHIFNPYSVRHVAGTCIKNCMYFVAVCRKG